ncbi:hypothetical protein [Hydrogenophaga palleronii]|uniref:hypothetical protein n=1 Tax=Hydrogenophaga palleronii TaxID=65655 RepID=UPI000B0954E6|nr:hypothetical protein [Hydrogenophaga palleronii]
MSQTNALARVDADTAQAATLFVQQALAAHAARGPAPLAAGTLVEHRCARQVGGAR